MMVTTHLAQCLRERGIIAAIRNPVTEKIDLRIGMARHQLFRHPALVPAARGNVDGDLAAAMRLIVGEPLLDGSNHRFALVMPGIMPDIAAPFRKAGIASNH